MGAPLLADVARSGFFGMARPSTNEESNSRVAHSRRRAFCDVQSGDFDSPPRASIPNANQTFGKFRSFPSVRAFRRNSHCACNSQPGKIDT